MTTEKQKLGKLGQDLVRRNCGCPKCKRKHTLKGLTEGFKCADIICDFCGFLAQVKTSRRKNLNMIPASIVSAAWRPQKERMDAGIYFSTYFVNVDPDTKRRWSIYYLPAELQLPEMFKPRNPLKKTAKRANWQGYVYKFTSEHKSRIIKLQTTDII